MIKPVRRTLKKNGSVTEKTEPLSFATQLIAWQKQAGRHDLPWQRTHDAYRIWLSEIMLQQTQVSTVIPYYQTFLEQFPTVKHLAAASLDQVLSLWAGLGYYARARNLHRCAQQVVQEHEGIFPTQARVLITLPGIGRSTAAAIAVFSSGEQAAILDGNVKRVFCRYFGIDGLPTTKAVENQLWAIAERELPTQDIEAYTQGLMDFGATFCTRTRPRCADCFAQTQCVAAQTNRAHELPTPKPRTKLPQRQVHVLLYRFQDQIYLEQRPEKGIWGGLWSLPEQAIAPNVRSLKKQGLAGIDSCTALPVIQHTFTHFRLDILPWRITLNAPTASSRFGAGQWIKLEDLARYGLPKPIKALIEQIVQAEAL